MALPIHSHTCSQLAHRITGLLLTISDLLQQFNDCFHRCFVPECESQENARYNADWVKDILPGSVSESSGAFKPEDCSRYIFNNRTDPSLNETCSANWFGHNEERCYQWVFDETERTIVNDVS